MRRSTIAKRLAKSSANKTTFAYKVVAEIAGVGKCTTYQVRNNVIRPCYTSGSGRYISNQDHTTEVRALLDELNVRYEFGNDAARGGLTGNFIKILHLEGE